MHTPSAKVRLAVAAALLLAIAVGCDSSPPPQPQPQLPHNAPPLRPISGDHLPVAVAIVGPRPGEPVGDNRSYWTYNGGHLAQGVGEAWFEHTAEVKKAGSKPWELREVSRDKEYIELYDANRAVTVRLSSTEMQARWDKDGKDAEWKTLQKGKWGRPE